MHLLVAEPRKVEERLYHLKHRVRDTLIMGLIAMLLSPPICDVIFFNIFWYCL